MYGKLMELVFVRYFGVSKLNLVQKDVLKTS